jgi:hypothetical protein
VLCKSAIASLESFKANQEFELLYSSSLDYCPPRADLVTSDLYTQDYGTCFFYLGQKGTATAKLEGGTDIQGFRPKFSIANCEYSLRKLLSFSETAHGIWLIPINKSFDISLLIESQTFELRSEWSWHFE